MLSFKHHKRHKKPQNHKKKYLFPKLKDNQTLDQTQITHITHKNNQKNYNITSSITYSMRAILVDWLMQVSSQFEFQSITFHKAVDIADRYLQQKDIPKDRFQLLGVTALFLAHKIQQVNTLQMKMFQEVTNGEFVEEQIGEMQQNICIVLKWRVHTPVLFNCLNEILYDWDQHVKQTEFQYTQYNSDKNRNNQTIFNALDFIVLGSPQVQPKLMAFALLFKHLSLRQTKDSITPVKAVFQIFLRDNKTSFKFIQPALDAIQHLIGSTDEFEVCLRNLSLQPYTNYLGKFYQLINK